MTVVLITGCSRGLGLELTRLLSTDQSISKVTATARAATPPPALQDIITKSDGRATYIQLSTTDPESIKAAVEQTTTLLNDSDSNKGIDILINNAGILHAEPNGIESIDSTLVSTLDTNVIGVHRITAAFLPLIRKGSQKKIANITSTLGSIAMIQNFLHSPTLSYKVSKAALNMLTAQHALELKKEGFVVFVVSPGWLKTDLGGQYADLEADVGARATWDVIVGAAKVDNGVFRNVSVPGYELYDGLNPPW